MNLSKHIASLIVKDFKGELNEIERLELFEWINTSDNNRELYDYLSDEEHLKNELREMDEAKENIWDKVEKQIAAEEIKEHGINTRRKFMIAATVVLILISAGSYWVLSRSKQKPVAKKEPVQLQNDIAPGGNRAVLTLEDGKKIILDSAHNGTLSSKGNVKINKQDALLSYDVSKENYQSNGNASLIYNTLTTPRGGQYKLMLPDGSSVWLNTASSIRFPIAFPENDRTVEITGEVYFEIAHDRQKPFKVFIMQAGKEEGQNRKAEVEVLGTHFNINAYSDEATIKTTLLKGKVKFTYMTGKDAGTIDKKILSPGQQVQLNPKGQIKIINDSDIEEAVAWKNGEFLFRSVDIKSLLRQAGYWYDIEVLYPHGVPNDKFNGAISRNVTLTQFLQILQYSEVKFKIEGRKLTILP